MSPVLFFQRHARNNAWSNHRLLKACAALSREAYEARRTSFFPSIPETLNHILIVDWYYVDALEAGGKGRALFADEMPCREIGALSAAQHEVDARLVRFCDALAAESLAAQVRLERRDHFQVETVADTLMHLFTHQTHHRGQVHAMLAGTDVPPPQLDEFFMREELALRETELREIGLPVE